MPGDSTKTRESWRSRGPCTHKYQDTMDILFLLIPLSVGLAFFILGALGWAIYTGQFDDVEREGERILEQD